MHTVYPATTFDVSITYPSTDYPVPTYGTGTATEQADGWAFFTSTAMVHVPDWSNGSGRPGILACHGGNQTASSTFAPGDAARWGDYTRALADYGFVVLALDLGFSNGGNNLAMRALDLAYTHLTGITGVSTVGMVGSSAGALACLSWSKKWPTRVGGIYLLNPFIDMDTSRGTAGWTTPYSVQAGDPNADIVYGTTPDPSTSNGAYKCSDDAGFTTNAINQGHTPARYPTDWAGQNIVLAHAHRDATVPYQSSQWWASAVNSPTVRFRPVAASTAGHEPDTLLAGGATDSATATAGGLPRSELRDFFHEVL